jgi:hypothetical protein
MALNNNQSIILYVVQYSELTLSKPSIFELKHIYDQNMIFTPSSIVFGSFMLCLTYFVSFHFFIFRFEWNLPQIQIQILFKVGV